MRLAQTAKPRRSAFTLVELLVVIMIIVVLVALTAGTVFKALARGAEVQNRNGITQLSNGVAAFKTKFGRIPPSRIRLCKNITQYQNTQLDQDSIAFIHSMFPRCDATWASANGIQWTQAPGWSGDTTLEGEQCLVFFLGGIQVNANGTNGCVGFSTNPANPGDTASTTNRIGPFVQFEPNRLLLSPPAAGAPFFVYSDPYEAMPYAYFSSYNVRNGYNRYGAPTAAGAVSDCTSLGVWPFQDPTGSYYNPDSFQIISAGPNQKFGPGQTWSPTNAQAIGPQGIDDISNFYDQVLGHASGG
jgi:prepilin-type N-terminal cleavage/methylation domain-containing protein